MLKNLIVIIAAALFSFSAYASPIGNPIISIHSAATEGSHILKSSQGYLNGFSATSGASSGYVLIIDSATVPADGVVATALCYSWPANTSASASWLTYPVPFTNGIVIVFSTGADCFHKTASSTAFFSAQIQ